MMMVTMMMMAMMSRWNGQGTENVQLKIFMAVESFVLKLKMG